MSEIEIWIHRSKEVAPDVVVLYLTTQWSEPDCMDIVETASTYLRRDFKRIVFDFGDIRTTAVEGFGQLVRVKKEVEEVGGSIALCNLPYFVEEPFRLTGFLEFYDVYETIDEAAR